MRQPFLFFLFHGAREAEIRPFLGGLHRSRAYPIFYGPLLLGRSTAITVPFKAALISMAKLRQFLGVTPLKWLEYLIAILIGNAIYYLSLVPHLPEPLRHRGFGMDGGVLVDFAVCVAVYGLIRLGIRLNVGFLSKLRDGS
jgi:hypothetical protein